MYPRVHVNALAFSGTLRTRLQNSQALGTVLIQQEEEQALLLSRMMIYSPSPTFSILFFTHRTQTYYLSIFIISRIPWPLKKKNLIPSQQCHHEKKFLYHFDIFSYKQCIPSSACIFHLFQV